jgi:hypothetical protein
MSKFYSKSEVEAIQEGYRYLFPVISKKLEQFWYLPDDRYDWLCLATPFYSGPTFDKFQAFDADLKRVNTTPEPDVIGSKLADLAKKHGVGYSIGLNPWADYLLFLASQTHAPREVVVVVAYNWYPLVTTDKKLPNSPLYKDTPLTFENRKYAFVFEPFLNDDNSPLVFFTNIFPHFMEAGKPATKGLSPVQKNFIGGNEGMRAGMVWPLEAINPSIKIRGLVTLGGEALAPLTTTKLGDFMNAFQTKLQLNLPSIDKALPTFRTRDKNIPWLPYYHPAARELIPLSTRPRYHADYSKLAEALLRRSRESD